MSLATDWGRRSNEKIMTIYLSNVLFRHSSRSLLQSATIVHFPVLSKVLWFKSHKLSTEKKDESCIFFYPGGVHAKMQVYANNEHTGAKKKFVKFCYLGRTNRTVFSIFLQSLEFQILVFRSVDHCIIISRHFQPKLSFNKRRNFSQFPVRLWSQVSLK